MSQSRVSTAPRPHPTDDQIVRRLNVLNEAHYDAAEHVHGAVRQNAAEIADAILRWFQLYQISVVLDEKAQRYKLSVGGSHGGHR